MLNKKFSLRIRNKWDSTLFPLRRKYLITLLNKYKTAQNTASVLGLSRQRIHVLLRYLEIKKDVKWE